MFSPKNRSNQGISEQVHLLVHNLHIHCIIAGPLERLRYTVKCMTAFISPSVAFPAHFSADHTTSWHPELLLLFLHSPVVQPASCRIVYWTCKGMITVHPGKGLTKKSIACEGCFTLIIQMLIPFVHTIIMSMTHTNSVFLLSNRNMVFNQSAHLFSWGRFFYMKS